MDNQKVKQVLDVVSGLSYSEWSKIRTCIEKSYDSARSKVELQNTESLEIFLNQEFEVTQ